MTETPGERLRRIISSWRRQKKRKPSSTATTEASDTSPSPPPPGDKTTQPLSQPRSSTHKPSAEQNRQASHTSGSAAPDRALQTGPPTSEGSVGPSPQTGAPPGRPTTKPAQPVSDPIPDSDTPKRPDQATSPLGDIPAQPTSSPRVPSDASGARTDPSAPQAPPNAGPRVAPSLDTRLLSRLSHPRDDLDRASSSAASESEATTPPSPSPKTPPLESAPTAGELKTPDEARLFLERLRAKTAQVVRDFSNGAISQRQFQAVYSHYQRQLIAVEKALIEMPGSNAWRAAAVEGHTSFLRQKHAAQVVSYAIYETGSGIPLAHVGGFKVDEALLVPMLSTFRSSTQELFGAGMKRIELEGGQWLCYVPGRRTTLIVVFSAEPAITQLKTIEDSHRDFELVYQMNHSSRDVRQLAHTFTSLWAFEQGPNAS